MRYFPQALIYSNLTLALDLISKSAFFIKKKDSYALYLSYGALISSITFVESKFIFSYSQGILFGKFWQKMRILENYENKQPHIPRKPTKIRLLVN